MTTSRTPTSSDAAHSGLVYRCVPTTSDDLAVLARMLGGLGAARDVRCVTLPGPPRPKERPRFNRATGNAYVSREARQAAAHTRGLLVESGVRCDTGPLAVALLFARTDRRRVDLDNFVKECLDCANGVVWGDDSQVMALAARMIVDPRLPRTVLAVASL